MGLSRAASVIMCFGGVGLQFLGLEMMLAEVLRGEAAGACAGLLLAALSTGAQVFGGAQLMRAKNHHRAMGWVALLPALGVLLLLLLPDGEHEESRPQGFEVIPLGERADGDARDR